MQFRIWSVLFALALAALSGRALADDVVIHMPPYASDSGAGTLATSAPLRVAIDATADLRPGGVPSSRIGARDTIGDIPMGEVESSPPPARLLQDVLRAEFSAAGHAIVEDDPEIRVMAEMRDFRLWTDATVLYWDVKAAVTVTIVLTDFTRRTDRRDYSADCRQRTYLWPGPLVMSEVVSDCLHQIGSRLKGDEGVRQFMNSIPEKLP